MLALSDICTEIWSILLAERGKRTVILTTHFLDEAEFLADHMVIMHDGELKAEGSVSELKSKLGSGYRVHILPNVSAESDTNIKQTSDTGVRERVTVVPDSAAVVAEIEKLDKQGRTHYQITGPTIEEVFMKLAAPNESARLNYIVDQDEDMEDDEKHVTTSTTDVQLDLAAASGTAVGSFRQVVFLFLKRFNVLKRNPVPTLAALIIPLVGAGFVSFLTKGEQNPGCTLFDQVASSDNVNLTTSYTPYLVVGPPGTFNNQSLSLILKGLGSFAASALGASNGSFADVVHTVNSLSQFNSYTSHFQANITPGGFWLGNSSSPPTFDYIADIPVGRGNGITGVYNAIFIQNILNMLLTNTPLVTNYEVFNFPWPTVTSNNIQFVFYFGLVMAAYPAFFTLYPTRERIKNVRALEYSNGVRPFPLWFAYLLFDFIFVLIASAFVVIIFAATSGQAWWKLGYIFLILILYGIASILLAYTISLIAKSQLSAFAFAAGGQA